MAEQKLAAADTDAATRKIARLIANIERAIHGKREAIQQILVGLLACGHVLIEDVPGVGKTTLARALARSVACGFCRIQFTPDLLPSDVLGVSVYDQKTSAFVFHKGPLFANIVLADEINRTAPRTQSALLEAMNSFQVSIDGTTHVLPQPFMVLATDNPIEYAGTYPLPEAQLDRFLLRIKIGYPDRGSELKMLKGHQLAHPIDNLKPVVTARQVLEMQAAVHRVAISDALCGYILDVARRTREHKDLLLGVSPRGVKMLARAAQARAFVLGRAFVLPDDVKALAPTVLAHRMVARHRDIGGHRGAESILAEVLDAVEVPL